ncbi:MAG TPA: DinB family protein [Candidatus Angelobacter sp.]|nr:DinB family protein [Candidatus Angelobacter sp.]
MCCAPTWRSWQRSDLKELQVSASVLARLRSLNEDDFSRTGIHSKLGEMTLALWLEFFLVHEGHHLNVVLGQRKAWQVES